MSGQYRTIFVGLRVEPSAALAANLEAVASELRGLGAGASVVHPANHHFTLAFVGQPPLAEVRARFEACVATLPAGLGPFEVELTAIAGFGTPQLPARVVFASPAPSARLAALAHAFRPMAEQDAVLHLTLGRTRTREASVHVRDHLFGPRALGGLRVRQVSLMANDGSGRYVDLSAVDL